MLGAVQRYNQDHFPEDEIQNMHNKADQMVRDSDRLLGDAQKIEQLKNIEQATGDQWPLHFGRVETNVEEL